MKIAICDDEKRICSILEEKVKSFCQDADIISFTSGKDLIESCILPDILLLDIKMPDMDGMAVAKILRDRDWRKILIFITGEKDQVFSSFDLRAFHFLVKPVSDEKLQRVLADAVNELKILENNSKRTEKNITVQSGTSHICINISELIYAEVFNRKTILHTKNDNIEYYGQLSALEELVGNDFHRVHRSYLVNMKYIERYDRASVTLAGNISIPIARRGYEEFLNAYVEYSRRRIDS